MNLENLFTGKVRNNKVFNFSKLLMFGLFTINFLTTFASHHKDDKIATHIIDQSVKLKNLRRKKGYQIGLKMTRTQVNLRTSWPLIISQTGKSIRMRSLLI